MATIESDLDIVSRVPSTVWEKIFQHASVLQLLEFRQICCSWRSTVDGCPALLKRIMLKFPDGFTLDREYEPGYLVPTRNLSLEKVHILTVDTWWPTFAQQLVFLSISDCSICCSTLVKALKPLTNLKELQLSKMKMRKRSGLTANFELQQVEKLTVTDLNEEIFCFLAPMFTQLKWIDLPRLDPKLGISESIIIDVLRPLKHTLTGITLDYTPAMLNEILQLKRLTHLMVRTGEMNNQVLTTIGTEFPHLKRIQVCLIRGFAPLTFLETIPEIEEICLTSAVPKSFNVAGLKNPNLTHFKLKNGLLHDNSIFQYLENSPKVIDICFFSCRLSSWFDVFSILELFCSTLQRLELSSFQFLSNPGDYRLSEYFDSLRYLKLKRCEMNKVVLISIISPCPRLEEVHLEEMKHVDDDVLLVLSQKLKHLEKLTLDNCGVTDSRADYIVEHFRSLKQLTIRSSSLTNGAKDKLKKLEKLRCKLE